jgi:2-methylisocitrate lyase-like PEP mutase family enzyme
MSNADIFHALHASGFLILPNCWDAGSARIIETLGAKAVATSSAAVCWAHGYADGHHLPVDFLIATVREITRVVSLPVTCDFEGGYADDPAQVAENIARVIDAGAVGINIEDGREPPALLAAKIAAVREAVVKAGVNLFINARTDVFLKGLAQGEAAVAETLRRGQLYREAGADGLFVPYVVEEAHIAAIAADCGLPLNVMARPGLPLAARLEALRARRLSSATGLARAALAALTTATTAFLETGDSDALAAAGGEPTDYNKLFL